MQGEIEDIKPGDANHPEDKSLIKWQYTLLPLMRKLIIGLALFFFLRSFAELFYMQSKILQAKCAVLNQESKPNI